MSKEQRYCGGPMKVFVGTYVKRAKVLWWSKVYVATYVKRAKILWWSKVYVGKYVNFLRYQMV